MPEDDVEQQQSRADYHKQQAYAHAAAEIPDIKAQYRIDYDSEKYSYELFER